MKSILKIAEDYNKIASHYAVTRQFELQEFCFFKPYVKKNMHVADIGCGSGRGYLFLKNLNIPFNYIGVDISTEQLHEAKKQFPNGTFMEGNMTSLPLGIEKFDIVFMIASLHHLPTKKDRLKALQETYRILKPNSVLCMTNWNLFQKKFRKYFPPNALRAFCSLGKYSVKDFFFPWKNNTGEAVADRYYYALTKGEMRKLCEKAGFTIIKNIYTKGNKEDTIFSAYNLVTIARKSER